MTGSTDQFTVRIVCDRQPEHAKVGAREVQAFRGRIGLDWTAAKQRDGRGRLVRSRSVSALDGDTLLDRQAAMVVPLLRSEGRPLGSLRERIVLECPVCRQRVEVRSDNERFARVLDWCAQTDNTELPLGVLKRALSMNL